MSNPAFEESYESIDAHECLKLVWFIRGAFDLFLIICFGYLVFLGFVSGRPEATVLILVITMLPISELYFIYGFYQRSENALIALHVYAGLSLLNFPIGTALSLYHYVKARDIKWS